MQTKNYEQGIVQLASRSLKISVEISIAQKESRKKKKERWADQRAKEDSFWPHVVSGFFCLELNTV